MQALQTHNMTAYITFLNMIFDTQIPDALYDVAASALPMCEACSMKFRWLAVCFVTLYIAASGCDLANDVRYTSKKSRSCRHELGNLVVQAAHVPLGEEPEDIAWWTILQLVVLAAGLPHQ